VVALGVTDVRRAAEFWSQALGYELRADGFGGWATVLAPPDGAGPKIALQHSQTPPQEHPRLHLDLHVADAAEQAAEAERLVSLGAERVDWDSYPDDPESQAPDESVIRCTAGWRGPGRALHRRPLWR
jgi:catechol 2,3-dioxygenase-like lactoylglutathione lyase family enzyme